MKDAFKKFDLSGKTALVTGGGTGIGYNIARALAQSGARVVIAARREDVLRAAAEKLFAETGCKVIWKAVDLGSRESTASLIAYSEGLGGIDIFVGNAATEAFQKVETITDESIDMMFRVNVVANIELTRGFLPHMRKKRWGRIILCSSASTKCISKEDGLSVYAATKGALETFAQVVAAETGEDGITANTLVLGAFRTEMVERGIESLGDYGKKMEKILMTMTATGRLGETSEIEGQIQLLASDAGSYITGARVGVDGGMPIIMRPNVVP